jgi:deoxyribonuclease V
VVLACVDVSYRPAVAMAACLLFVEWSAPDASAQFVSSTPLAAPYKPGEFYLRELPPILDVLSRVHAHLDAIVVDGYAWLGSSRPGLGARLHSALGGRVPIVGVAKTAWAAGGEVDGASDPHRTVAVVRGQSVKPLFVTSAGIDVEEAAARVAAMNGAHRIPTLLKAVDTLARQAGMA